MLDMPVFTEGSVVGNGDVRNVAHGNDSGLWVEFRLENVYLAFRSEQEGKPVYEKRPFIRIYTPGDSKKVVDREVQMESLGGVPSDPQRFPLQWAAFQQGVQATATGLPLEEWPLITTGQVKALNAINIYTVEQLAQVPDSALDNLGHGGRALRDQAKAKCENMDEAALANKLAAEKEDLQRQIDELKAAMEAKPGKKAD